MKEKDKKTISIVCLIAGFIITLFVVQLIYTLTLRQWLDHKTAKAFLNIGWIYFCMYVYYRLSKRYTSIIVNLDVMMAKRKISLGELAEKIDLTPANLSILKTGKAKAIRFSTLEAICKELDCQPGDILEYREENE